MNAYRDQYAQLFKDGRKIVLIAISADVDTALASWARDAEYPYLFASDTGSTVGKAYGAFNAQYKLDNRNLFVVGPDGKFPSRAPPSGKTAPPPNTNLEGAIKRLFPGETTGHKRGGKGGRGARGGRLLAFPFSPLPRPCRRFECCLNIL